MTDERSSAEIEDEVTDEIGGVQGTDDTEEQEVQPAQSARIGSVPDEPAPDGAEIEWAGGVVKKPPTPNA